MVGLLRDPLGNPLVQESYEANRGRFYMFWNCTKASGKPTLGIYIISFLLYCILLTAFRQLL